jgi:hypothetical protein
MSDFIKVKATSKSLLQRKLAQGVGINDAWYLITQVINGKRVICPIYSKWTGVLARCYSSRFKETNPTYSDCSLSKEWLTFSNFSKWFELNNVDGYALDKDIKIKGNKVYSPDTCLFVPQSINNLILGRGTKGGSLPQGVSFNKLNGRYGAHVAIDSKYAHIGQYATPELASNAYIKAKNAEIMRKSEQYPEFAKYLINHLIEEKS